MVTFNELKNTAYGGGAGGKQLVEISCLSTDTKPTENIMNGSELRMLDPEAKALTVYYFNEAEVNDADKWVPVAYVAYDGPEPSNGSAEVTP